MKTLKIWTDCDEWRRDTYTRRATATTAGTADSESEWASEWTIWEWEEQKKVIEKNNTKRKKKIKEKEKENERSKSKRAALYIQQHNFHSLYILLVKL